MDILKRGHAVLCMAFFIVALAYEALESISHHAFLAENHLFALYIWNCISIRIQVPGSMYDRRHEGGCCITLRLCRNE